MDLDEALRLLRGGTEGVTEWNRRRSEGEEIPELTEADLTGANLRGANLTGANLRGANLGGADLLLADLPGANLSRAYLSRANLRGANLRGANLRDANLRDANLSDANLCEADFIGADLSGADLRWAVFRPPVDEHEAEADQEENNEGEQARFPRKPDLRYANFRGADLTRADWSGLDLMGTKLQEADLTNANLRGVQSLFAERLAGANITNAKLPEEIKQFEVLEVIKDVSSNARKIYLSMLLGCAYAWLTIATTTDARLLTNSATFPLPIIRAEIQIAWFYWAAPAILLGLFVYLHLYLKVLWKGLAGLPARFPDGKPLDQRAYPWLLNGLVRRHVRKLREGRGVAEYPKEWISIFLAWWVVPLTLLGFWVRYLPRHHLPGTVWQVFLSVAVIWFGVVFYRSAALTLRGHLGEPFLWKWPWRDRRSYQAVFIVFIAALLAGLSYGAIRGVPSHEFRYREPESWVPWAFGVFGYSTFANLQEEDVSARPADYHELAIRVELATLGVNTSPFAKSEESESDDPADSTQHGVDLENLRKILLDSISGANLAGRDLRHARAERAFLVKADLRGAVLSGAALILADLSGADLTGADLRDADLTGANLRGADLTNANLTRAILAEAHLVVANLRGADLTEADLYRADLTGAYLIFANLTGVYLSEANLTAAISYLANLTGADFTEANLTGADFTKANLTGAVGLACARLVTTQGWQSASRDPELACGAEIPQPAKNETAE